MSDIDDDEYYDYEGDLDWLYVEEHYDEADELAEHACPSPAIEYTDPNDDYDPYSYFEDISYLSDGFYDAERPPKKPASTSATTGSKRKRASQSASKHNAPRPKRPRRESPPLDPATLPPVKWRARNEDRAGSSADVPTVRAGSMPVVSLFKDWRQQYKDGPALATAPPKSSAIEEDMSGLDSPPPSDAFNVDDLSSVLKLLSKDDVDRMRAALKEKGLDDAALELVLEDLQQGHQREFPDDNDDDEEVDDAEDQGQAAPDRASSSLAPPSRKPAANGTTPSSSAGPPPRAPKRKHAATHPADLDGDGDGDDDDIGGPRARSKRARPAPDIAAEPAPPARPTRSTRRRKP